jgi:hypothetical protein
MVPARVPQIDLSLKQLGYERYGFQEKRFVRGGEGHTSSWYLRPKHLETFRCQFGQM